MLGSLALLIGACTQSSAPPAASSSSAAGSSPAVSAACAGQPKVGGIVKVINDGGGTNPIVQSEVLIWNIFDGLLQQDITGALHPGLAESWDISSDGLTYTFHMRHNAVWSDGTPIDSSDVTMTFEKVMNPDIAAANRRFFAGVLKSWTAPDQWTVVFQMSLKASPVLSYFAEQRIAPKSVFGNLSAQDVNTKFKQEAPVSSGPYKWVKTVPDQVVQTVRNDKYYFPRGSNDYRTVPWIDELDFYPFGDSNANILSMRTADRDVYALTMSLPEYQEISKIQTVRTTLHPVGIYNFLQLNNKNPLFSDVRVRQAMLYAIDRQTMVSQLLAPIAIVMDSFVDPSNWAYKADVKKYPYDVNQAKQLLSAAGWTPGADGILTKGGTRFSFESVTDRQSLVVEAIQSYLKAVGIEMKLKGLSGTSVTRAELLAYQQSPDFVSAQTNLGYEVYANRRHTWLSTLAPPAGNNFSRYSNPELDAVLNDSWAQPDRSAAQKADFYKMQDILANDVPYLPMYYPLMVQAVNTRVCGAEQGSVYILQTAAKWWVNG